MATPLICLKISPENVKQFSVKTSSAKRSSVSVEGSLTVRWSKKYLSAKSPSLFGITVYSWATVTLLEHQMKVRVLWNCVVRMFRTLLLKSPFKQLALYGQSRPFNDSVRLAEEFVSNGRKPKDPLRSFLISCIN